MAKRKNKKLITRRDFLVAGAVITAAGALTACSSTTDSGAEATVTETETKTVTKTATSPAEEPTFAALNPRGTQGEIELTALVPYPSSLDGKKILVLNLHGGNEEVMAALAEDLQAELPEAEVIHMDSELGHRAGRLSDGDWAIINEMKPDVIIGGHDF